MTSTPRPLARHIKNILLIIAAQTLLVLAAVGCIAALLPPGMAARVLFSETASCTPHERLLVAGIMQNRIHNPAFGNAATLDAVASQPGAFSCVDDPGNTNWRKTRFPGLMTPTEQSIWNRCLALIAGPPPPALGPTGRPLVYYHDKSISKPASWNNAKWQAVREVTTEHLIFYSVIPLPQPRP